jgi:hypothetical protein
MPTSNGHLARAQRRARKFWLPTGHVAAWLERAALNGSSHVANGNNFGLDSVHYFSNAAI